MPLDVNTETVNLEQLAPVRTSEPNARRGTLRRWWLVLLLLLTGWAGYHGWRWFETRQFRRRCEIARQVEDWHSLSSAGKAWGAWDPAAGRAWWYAAEAAQELEDLEDLASCLGNVPPSDPKVLIAYVEKANLEWTALNRPREALETSRQVIAMDPRVTEVQARVISFYATNLQRAKLLRAIRAAIAAGSEPREAYTYLIMADDLSFSNGAKLNSAWLAAAPDELRFKIALAVHTSQGVSRNAEATGAADAKELDQHATQQLEWFLEQVPHDVVLLTHMMNRAYRAGDVQRVGELLKLVDEGGVDDHMVWVYRCWYHVANDEFANAEEAIQEALRLHPLSPLAHHEYANLLRKSRRPEEKIDEQQKMAAAGRELRTDLLRMSNAPETPTELLQQIAIYAELCGDRQVAGALQVRLGPPAIESFGLPIR